MTVTEASVELELGNEGPTGLYRFYAASGVLLYVGITSNLSVRLTQHAADKPWWPEVARKTVTWHLSRAAARAAEVAAIKEERPRHNIRDSDEPGDSFPPGSGPPRSWPYEQAAAEIRRRIQAGQLGPRLPSRMKLAAELGVAVMTVDRAIGVLKDEGLIVTEPGRGTFVKL